MTDCWLVLFMDPDFAGNAKLPSRRHSCAWLLSDRRSIKSADCRQPQLNRGTETEMEYAQSRRTSCVGLPGIPSCRCAPLARGHLLRSALEATLSNARALQTTLAKVQEATPAHMAS